MVVMSGGRYVEMAAECDFTVFCFHKVLSGVSIKSGNNDTHMAYH